MRLSGPTFESADPRRLASFYARLLGWTVERSEGPRSGNPPADGWSLIRSPDGDHKIEFQWDPQRRRPVWPSVDGEPAVTMHLDVGVILLKHGCRPDPLTVRGAHTQDHQIMFAAVGHGDGGGQVDQIAAHHRR